MTVQLFPEPNFVHDIVQRQIRRDTHRPARHQASHKRMRPRDRRNILIVALATVVALPLVHHSGTKTATEAGALSQPKPGHPAAAKVQPAAIQANAFHGSFPASITRWQGDVDRALANPRTATKYKVRGNPDWQHMNILALPGQRSIIYSLMRLSGGDPKFNRGSRMGLLPMTLAQRLTAAHEMNLHYTTSGPTWAFNSLLLGIRTANDDLFSLVVKNRSNYQHDMCVLHDSGRALVIDFLMKWDPGMPVAQIRQFVNWYVQWGPKGLDPSSLQQFCVGAK